MKSALRPVAWLMVGRALGQAVAFVIPVVLVRTFDPALFGSYKRLFLLYGTLYGIAQLGLAESLYFFVPRDPVNAGKLAANAMLGLAAAGLVCIALLTGARTAVATGLGDAGLASLVPWVGLFLAPMLVSSVLEIAMVSRKSHAQAALAYMGSDLLRAGFLVLPALLFFSLRALLAGAIAFALARLAATLWWLGKQLGELRFDRALLRVQLGYALPFALAVTVDMVQANFHQYVVSSRSDAAAFAVYSVALLQVPLVDQTATTTSSVAMVQMGEAMHHGRPEAVPAIWHDIVYKLAALFFPLVALLVVAAREMLALLFTDRYAASVPLFQIASLGILLFALQTDSVLRVLAQTRFFLALNLLRLAVVAALIFPLIARFQLMGAVAATLLAALVARALALLRIAQLLHLRPGALLPWRRLSMAAGASAIAGLCAEGARAAVRWPALPRLIFTSAVFVLVYAALARALGMLPPLGPSGWLNWIRGSPDGARALAKETPCAASPES